MLSFFTAPFRISLLARPHPKSSRSYSSQGVTCFRCKNLCLGLYQSYLFPWLQDLSPFCFTQAPLLPSPTEFQLVFSPWRVTFIDGLIRKLLFFLVPICFNACFRCWFSTPRHLFFLHPPFSLSKTLKRLTLEYCSHVWGGDSSVVLFLFSSFDQLISTL